MAVGASSGGLCCVCLGFGNVSCVQVRQLG
jgi:hypothetical protein